MPRGQEILRQPLWYFHSRSGKTRDQLADLIGAGMTPVERGQQLLRPHQHWSLGEKRIEQGRRNIGRGFIVHEIT
jgi:hypothetical protein